MHDFISQFWGYYIAVIVVVSLFGLICFCYSLDIVRVPKGQQAEIKEHVWDDDLREYNNPLPRWWLFTFYLTIVFGVGYLMYYPALGVFKGLGGWSSAQELADETRQQEARIAPLYARYRNTAIPDLAKDRTALQLGHNLFQTHCIQCHGTDARGAKGFPNLAHTDNADWLYGNTPEKLTQTITAGRQGIMPPWGPTLGEEGVKDTAHYVLQLADAQPGAGEQQYDVARAQRGKQIFETNCAACHGAEAQGNQDIGAPRLAGRKTWLYGGDKNTIIETITNGRGNQMPAWEERLGSDKIYLLATYVYSRSHP